MIDRLDSINSPLESNSPKNKGLDSISLEPSNSWEYKKIWVLLEYRESKVSLDSWLLDSALLVLDSMELESVLWEFWELLVWYL